PQDNTIRPPPFIPGIILQPHQIIYILKKENPPQHQGNLIQQCVCVFVCVCVCVCVCVWGWSCCGGCGLCVAPCGCVCMHFCMSENFALIFFYVVFCNIFVLFYGSYLCFV